MACGLAFSTGKQECKKERFLLARELEGVYKDGDGTDKRGENKDSCSLLRYDWRVCYSLVSVVHQRDRVARVP